METKNLSKKSHGIVAAINAGWTCEQILAADSSLTLHDVFHAVSETPTSHWTRGAGGRADKLRFRRSQALFSGVRHRAD